MRACVCVRCALSSNKSFAAQLRWPNALSPARASALLPNRSPSVPRPLLLLRLILLPLLVLGRRASCPVRMCALRVCASSLLAVRWREKRRRAAPQSTNPSHPVTHPVTSPTAGGALSHSGAARPPSSSSLGLLRAHGRDAARRAEKGREGEARGGCGRRDPSAKASRQRQPDLPSHRLQLPAPRSRIAHVPPPQRPS